MYFVGSPTALPMIREMNRNLADAKKWRALAAEKEKKMTAERSEVCSMLGLPPTASDEQIYESVLRRMDHAEMISDGDTVQLGAGRARVVGASLAHAARILFAAGKARDLGEAQRLALRQDPGLYRP